MAKRRDIVLTEFTVEVRSGGIRWGGLDSFLWWLLHKKPREGFAPHAWKLNALGRGRRPRRSK
ncbi:MAG: hypothetical protein HY748_16460 [Elusimicrobia bacterium]|nr:hypothetical protein [Elusimicrobiota bacterium]